ncbi:MAG: DUF4019 domain-containing protein [Gammaproteobacteria bacterium]|nr:DUF4019 domain-containing protein [Gammaproteobacteria bacterium]
MEHPNREPIFSPSQRGLAVLTAHPLHAQDPEQPDTRTSSIGFATVEDALQSLRAKEGVNITNSDGWTVVDDSTGDNHVLWSFTPPGHPAHPAAVKRTVHEEDGAIWIDMNALCQAEKAPCDALIEEFTQLNEKIRQAVAARHPREDEATRFATEWLDLLERGKSKKAFELLTDTFRANLTFDQWREATSSTRKELGKLQSRQLRRVVWYQDPQDAPLPGTYAAVEFDSVYENASQHFQYVILHSLEGEPFRIMRNEATIVIDEGD